MPTPKIRQVVAAANTSTGDQDFTVSGFGTPVAAIVIVSGATVADTARDDALLSIGFTDGTNTVFAGLASDDGVDPTNCARAFGSTHVARIPDFSAGVSYQASASFVSWVTDGVRINWSTAPAAAYLVTVILIGGGATLSAAVGTVSLGTGTSAINTVVGFTPDLVLGLSAGTGLNARAAGVNLSLGAWLSGASQQGAVTYTEDDAAGTAAVAGLVSATYGLQKASSSAITYSLTFGTHPSGFGVTPSASAGSDYMGYLALDFDGLDASLTAETLPAGTGAYSKTGLSFKPGFLMTVGAAGNAAVDTLDTAGADAFAVTTVDWSGTAASLASTSYATEDGALAANTAGYASQSAEVVLQAGAVAASSSFTSFNADGWTKSLAATDTRTYKTLSLAIKANEALVPVFMHHRMQQGMS